MELTLPARRKEINGMYRLTIILIALLGASCSQLSRPSSVPLAGELNEAIVPLARAALEVGQIETAKRLYGRLLQVDPGSAVARMGLGDTALREGATNAAIRWYRDAIEHARSPSEARAATLAHARAALAAGDIETAAQSFGQLASDEVETVDAAWGFNGVGLTRLLAGDLPGALTAMREAVRRGPDEPRFQENLAKAEILHRQAERDGLLPDPSGVSPGPAPPAAAGDTPTTTVPEAPAASIRESEDALAAADELARSGETGPGAEDAALAADDVVPARDDYLIVDGVPARAGVDPDETPTAPDPSTGEESAPAEQDAAAPVDDAASADAPSDGDEAPLVDGSGEAAVAADLAPAEESGPAQEDGAGTDDEDAVLPTQDEALSDDRLREAPVEPDGVLAVASAPTDDGAAPADDALAEGAASPEDAALTDDAFREEAGLSDAAPGETAVALATASGEAGRDMDGVLDEVAPEASTSDGGLDAHAAPMFELPGAASEVEEPETGDRTGAGDDLQPFDDSDLVAVVLSDPREPTPPDASGDGSRMAAGIEASEPGAAKPVPADVQDGVDEAELLAALSPSIASDDQADAIASVVGLRQPDNRSDLNAVEAADAPPAVQAVPMRAWRGDSLFVEVGTYATPAAADEIVDELRGRFGHRAQIVEVSSSDDDAPWFRVNVGPFDGRAKAADVVAKAESIGLNPWILGVDPAPARPEFLVVRRAGDAYSVQAGAYGSIDKALFIASLIGRIAENPVSISETEAPSGDVVYRVRLGPVASRGELVNLATTLEDRGLVPFVIPPAAR